MLIKLVNKEIKNNTLVLTVISVEDNNIFKLVHFLNDSELKFIKNLKNEHFYIIERENLNENKIIDITQIKEINITEKEILKYNKKFLERTKLLEKIVNMLKNKQIKNKIYKKIFEKFIIKNLDELKYYPVTFNGMFNQPGDLLIRNLKIKEDIYSTIKILKIKNVDKEFLFVASFLLNSVRYELNNIFEVKELGKYINENDLLILLLINELQKDKDKIYEKLNNVEEKKLYYEKEYYKLNKLIENLENKKTDLKKKFLELKKLNDDKKLNSVIEKGKEINLEIDKLLNEIKKIKEILNKLEYERKNLKEEEIFIEKSYGKFIKLFKLNNEILNDKEKYEEILNRFDERSIEEILFIESLRKIYKVSSFIEEINKLKKENKTFSEKYKKNLLY